MFEMMPYERRANSLFSYFDNLEKEVFGSMNTMVSAMRTDILEQDGKYIVKAELPGFDREEISISVNNGRLTISAAHKEETEENKQNFVRRERRCGAFQRSFDITGIDTDKIAASYKDGILELTLPKTVPVEIPVHTVEIQ